MMVHIGRIQVFSRFGGGRGTSYLWPSVKQISIKKTVSRSITCH